MTIGANITRLNEWLGRDNIQSIRKDQPDVFALLTRPGAFVDLVDVAMEFAGERLQPEDRDYWLSMPTTHREAIRSFVAAAVDAEKPVTIAYTPAYDFNLRLWDWGHGVTCLVEAPYRPVTDAQRFGGG